MIEMLENSEEGAFFVRDSQSRPGCYALTVRVPYEVNDSGYGNYLITQEGGLFTIQVTCALLEELLRFMLMHTSSTPFRTTVYYRFHEEDKVLIAKIQLKLTLSLTLTPPRGGYCHIVWVGVCRWVRESPTLY